MTMRMGSLAAWCGGVLAASIALAAGCSGDDGSNTTTSTDNQGGAGNIMMMGGGGAGGEATCTPEDELCDGLDNDCDDQVDEDCPCIQGDTQSCFSGDPALLGIGVCAEGVQTCALDGSWGDCENEVVPSNEACNGDDDDCDDEIDEGFGAVTCGVGACQVTVQECIDGEPNPCIPGTANPVEQCDGVDDNCDGTIDEGCACVTGTTQPCYSGSTQTKNVGECHDGLQTCVNGAWSPNCVGEQLPALESCDGLDNDCNGVDDNGDPGGGAACNTGLDGVCAAGTEHCVSGGIACVQNLQPSADLCDGLDNDCNTATADGSADPGVNVACDGMDSDLCPEGVTACVSSNIVCGDTTGNTLDLCNGMDDDCDPSSADGSEDPQNGAGCDGADTDLCIEGVNICNNGGFVCSDNSTSTVDLCNGMDDDCDPASADGSEDPQIGSACDGPDTDLCNEGSFSCVSGAPVCSDQTSNNVELCNNLDDDCNPATADGTGAAWFNQPCDGPDGDLCNEGAYQCIGGAQTCSDNSGNTPDLCNNMNDDCNAATPDGSGELWFGAGCDGGDADLCNEGTFGCTGGVQSCSDNTSSNLELCNGLNDDCNAATADGAHEAWLGQACDGADSDMCLEGTYSCTSGAQSCSDNTTGNVEACNGIDDDCDGTIDDGWVRNDNPLCADGQFNIGSVSGDVGPSSTSDSWYDEEWDILTITENNLAGSAYLSASITLTSPPGTDYDLYVYCTNCTGTLAGSSINGGLTGHTDTVHVRKNDTSATDTFNVIIEVRHWDSNICANWTLNVTGDTNVGTVTCF